MRIELELPDWAGRSNLWILSDIEPVAYKLKDSPWMVKVSKCQMCGKCCSDLDENFTLKVIDKHCEFLEKEPGKNDLWRCSLGLFRPFQCCVTQRSNIPSCTVKYEEYRTS